MSDLFHWFLLALRFSATNSGMKKTLMISTGRCGLKLYVQNIFRKRITNMRFWIIYILVQVSFFCGTALGCFCQFFLFFFFWIFCCQSTMVANILLSPPPPTIKKLSTALHIITCFVCFNHYIYISSLYAISSKRILKLWKAMHYFENIFTPINQKINFLFLKKWKAILAISIWEKWKTWKIN